MGAGCRAEARPAALVRSAATGRPGPDREHLAGHQARRFQCESCMIRSQTNPHDAGKGLRVSFEFFPPKTDAMAARLWETVERLEPMAPDFVSVTYGAGGSTRERTHAIVKRMAEETTLRPAGHITCVAATKDEIDQVLRDYWAAGVKRIVALRGDPTDGIGTRYVPHPGGYAYASDLIAGARKIADFDISVGCYPEVHPDAPSLKAEVGDPETKTPSPRPPRTLPFFFYPDVFFKFIDQARAAGITQPIVPGIILQSNFKGLQRMARSEERRVGKECRS